jgi:Protein of unknown function (DUF3999)
MKSLEALAVLLFWSASRLTPAAELHPADFAYGTPIETRSPGTAYRFTLPVDVFMKVAHEDLRDLRVFNARGEVVPYELRQAAPRAIIRPHGPSLPLFPLHGDARASLDGIRVTIRSAGTAVDLRTGSSAHDPHVITSYVVDAREIAQPLSGLQLHWAADAPEFSGSLRIEASDDLGSWRVVKNGAPVIHLLTGSSELIQSLLEFPSTKARFWRLTWVGKTAPFELTSAAAEVAPDQPIAPQSTVTASGSRVIGKDGELSFDLGAKLPMTQMNLVLPEPNSALQVELLSRARANDSWRLVTQAEFYRVSTGSSDRNNEPIRIPTNSDRLWLVRQTEPAGPIGDVRLQATWDARELVFLARGSGPFVLAYGSATAGPSSVALEPLIKGITVLPAETGRPYVLGGADRLRPPPATVPWRMAALWSALALGVLGLAWMTYRLSRELGTRPAQ